MEQWISSPALSDISASQLKNDEMFREFAIKNMVTDVVNSLKFYGITRTPKKRDLKKITKLAEELISYPSLRGKGDFNPEDDLASVPKVKIIDKVSNLGDGEDTLHPGLYSLFDGAKESILLKNPYVLLTSEFAEALKRASSRGVRITIVTNSPLSGDSDLIEGFLISKWYKYLAAIPQLRLKVVGGTVPIHSKVGVIDGKICLIGSYNLDYLSAEVNGEILSVLWSEELATEMETFILSENEENTGLIEYTIRRDVNGLPLDSDPSTPEVEPYILFGPKEHVPRGFWKECLAKATQSRIVEKFIPGVDTLE
jgi:phosphatidylserine/phosphatidylglycerophosphate/cardiolipin synthase-like enzyme